MKWALATAVTLATATGLFRNVALSAWGERLGWTLVHSVWQLAVLGVVGCVILALSRRASPNARYSVGVVTLITMAAAPCVTWVLIDVDRSSSGSSAEVATVISQQVDPAAPAPIAAPTVISDPEPIPPMEPPTAKVATATTASAIPMLVPDPPAPMAPRREHWSWLPLQAAIAAWLKVIVVVWFVGLVLAAVRPLLGLWVQFRLRRIGLALVPAEIQQRLRTLAVAMKVSPGVTIAQSALARVPMVVGYLRPVILLPASAISGLTIGQLESLIAHELAHVRRHDWLVNALQIVIETVLFYHPAVWWISNRIRTERELCCDDLALSVIGDKVTYGRMLLALEELRHVPPPVLAATGGNLVQRIRRLLPVEASAVEGPRSWAPGIVVLMLFAVAGSFAVLSAEPTSEPIANERPGKATVIEQPADQGSPIAEQPNPVADIVEPQSPVPPPAVPGLQPQIVDTSAVTVSTVTKELPDFRHALDQCVFDISLMDVIANGSFSPSFASCLHFDRWLRNLGYGDVSWDATTSQWVAFRGTRLVAWDNDPTPDNAREVINAIHAKIAGSGRVTLPAAQDDSSRVAIQTAEGHVALIRTIKRTGRSLTVEVTRLTDAATVPREQPNDGVETAVWGPIVNGLQGGIALRGPVTRGPIERALGEMLPVKVFVRNASTAAKDYSWQLSQEPVRAALPAERIPLLPNWRPRLVDQADQLAIVATARQPHEAMQLNTVRLEPGQAVLVGAAALSLWPVVDAGFYVGTERQTPAVVSPGMYRLSTDIDTGLVSSPMLPTGELAVQVIEATGTRLDALRRLDQISRRIDNGARERTAWQDPAQADIRPAMPTAPVETLAIAMQAFDTEQNHPVAGATGRIKFFAWGQGMVETIIEYDIVSDARGYFTMRIPRKLLAGYEGWRPDFRVHLNHPQYCENFKSYSLQDLQQEGLISDQGQYLKDAAERDADKQVDFRRVDLKGARTVTGRILSSKGQPLAGVPIYGNNSLGLLSLFGNHRTDSEGRFRIQAATQELMKIEFRTHEFGRRLVDAAPGQTDLGDLRGGGGMRIRGQVLDAAGQPVKRVSVNTPSYPDRTIQPNFVYTTDDSGWFQTDTLEAGQYEAIVSDVRGSEDDGVRIVGPPPDLYLAVRFSVNPDEPPPVLTLRPARSQRLVTTLISTIVRPEKDKLPLAVDPVVWRIAKAKIERDRRAASDPPAVANDKTTPLKAQPLTGVLTLNLEAEAQLELARSLIPAFALVPAVNVSGKLNETPWSRTPNILELDGDANPSVYSSKIPADLTDVSIEAGTYAQHLQIGSGPLLFGTTLRLPKLDGRDLKLTIYRYRPTTLRVTFMDAANQPIVLKDDQLPRDLAVSAAYEREAEVRQAGAVFESSNTLMSRTVFDNCVWFFAIPGEAFDLTATTSGTAAKRRLLLRDGETTTLQIKLGTPAAEWSESSQPTSSKEGDQP